MNINLKFLSLLIFWITKNSVLIVGYLETVETNKKTNHKLHNSICCRKQKTTVIIWGCSLKICFYILHICIVKQDHNTV